MSNAAENSSTWVTATDSWKKVRENAQSLLNNTPEVFTKTPELRKLLEEVTAHAYADEKISMKFMMSFAMENIIDGITKYSDHFTIMHERHRNRLSGFEEMKANVKNIIAALVAVSELPPGKNIADAEITPVSTSHAKDRLLSWARKCHLPVGSSKKAVDILAGAPEQLNAVAAMFNQFGRFGEKMSSIVRNSHLDYDDPTSARVARNMDNKSPDERSQLAKGLAHTAEKGSAMAEITSEFIYKLESLNKEIAMVTASLPKGRAVHES